MIGPSSPALRAITLTAALGCSASSLLPATAIAQSRPTRLPALGRSVAGTDDTRALVLNPANLGFLPASELSYQGIFLEDSLAVPWQGHAFSLGVNLPFSLSTAARLDLINPPETARGTGLTDYQWFTWGVSLRASESMAIGATLQRSYSETPALHDISSYSIGLSTRPSDYLSFSVAAQHLGADLDQANTHLAASYDTAIGIRPLGTRTVELGLEARYLKDQESWRPRATLGVDIGPVGRVYGDFTIPDSDRFLLGDSNDPKTWQASLALALDTNDMLGSSELYGGSLTGNGLGADNSYNWQFGFAVRGWREPVGGEPRHYAVRIRLESTPGARGHVALLRQLWSLRDEPSVEAVILDLRAAPAGSLARVQELRDALFELRRHGKRTLCHLENASGSALYLCAAANTILAHPAGNIRFAGLRSRHLYFKGLLDKLGVHADFIHIGAHKSAPERFTRRSPTDTARADSIDLLQQVERHVIDGLSVARNIKPAELRRRIATGPFLAKEAVAANLIDDTAFDDEVDDKLEELLGHETHVFEDKRVKRSATRSGRQRKIALVYIDGDIVDGRSRSIPFLGVKTVGSYTIAETLKQVREDSSVGAVVLRIESPGGSSMASDVMWREIQLTQKKKPVIVSMGAYAASGGYYVAAPATRIFANPLTITGSIGIFFGKADISGLLSKVGVDVTVYKTGPRADAESMFRPFTPEERVALEGKLRKVYDLFLERVATGRDMLSEDVDKVAQGRVWTGEQAHARGLVDELGGLRQALAHARMLGELRDDCPIVELPEPKSSLLGKLLGIEGLTAPSAALPTGIAQIAKALAPFMIHKSHQALARLPYAPIED